MKARHSFMPGSLAQAGSVESFRKPLVMMPMPASSPAGFITEPTEIDTLVMKNIGFQPRSCALRIACAAVFGAAAQMNTSAPDDCNEVICESTVGSVASYDRDWMTYLSQSLASTSRTPFR